MRQPSVDPVDPKLGSFSKGTPNLKDLVASFGFVFRGYPKNKGLSGFVWVRFGFVFSVKSLIPNSIMGSFRCLTLFFGGCCNFRTLALG